MAPFPKTLDELKHAGYRYHSTRRCRRCPAEIEFWWTPDNKLMPLDVDGKGNVVTHWSTCPKAEAFRKPKQGALFA